jgi:hypothetical protein
VERGAHRDARRRRGEGAGVLLHRDLPDLVHQQRVRRRRHHAGWLQAWSDVNPVTHLSDAYRGLLVGGPVAEPVPWSLVWAVGTAAVFGPLAMRAYRAKV